MYSATERLIFGEILRFTHNDTGFYSVCHRLAMTNIRTSSRFFCLEQYGDVILSITLGSVGIYKIE